MKGLEGSKKILLLFAHHREHIAYLFNMTVFGATYRLQVLRSRCIDDGYWSSESDDTLRVSGGSGMSSNTWYKTAPGTALKGIFHKKHHLPILFFITFTEAEKIPWNVKNAVLVVE